MKLFGHDLFSYSSPKSDTLYDFNRWGLINNEMNFMEFDVALAENTTARVTHGTKPTKKKVEKPKEQLTPKQLHQMKALNDNKFSINVDPKYLDSTISEAKDKLALMPGQKKKKDGLFEGSSGPAEYGREEVLSIIERLENRKRLNGVKTTVDKYPHTTTDLINQVLKDHKHLRFEKAEMYVPNFPSEAVKAMKEYNEMCNKLCGKKAVFYVVSQKKDFEQVSKRRDPILVAQSPFGFFWQILGAWDEEMVYLEEL